MSAGVTPNGRAAMLNGGERRLLARIERGRATDKWRFVRDPVDAMRLSRLIEHGLVEICARETAAGRQFLSDLELLREARS